MLLKQYKSIFVADLEIDIANFITETLIKNGLEYYKKPLPNVAFWQKDIATSHPSLQNLHDRYIRELPEIRRYLKVFSPGNLLEVFKKKSLYTVFFLKKEQRKDLIYDLFLNQIRHVQDIEDKPQLETLDIKNFTETPKLLNNRKKIGL